MKTNELEKGVCFSLAESITYETNTITTQILLKKITGSVMLFSMDTGKILNENVSPFDTFLQAIEGYGEIVMNSKIILMAAGNAIIIPAHTRYSLKATDRFKMITIVIKSGYEEIS